jgi:hypothetical protein
LEQGSSIRVRGGFVLAGYSERGMRLRIMAGEYVARRVSHAFPRGEAPEDALEVTASQQHRGAPLFVKCAEYGNEVDWAAFPDGGQPYFVPA